MNDRNSQGISSSVKGARERAHCDVQAQAAPAEEWLDAIIRLALELSLRNARPSAAALTGIQERVEALLETTHTLDEE